MRALTRLLGALIFALILALSSTQVLSEPLQIGPLKAEFPSQQIKLISLDTTKPNRATLILQHKANIKPGSFDLRIKAAPNEFFTGVTERLVDGNQKRNWQPGIQTALNLRGQKMNVLVQGTLGLYAPFYLSSKNYGLWVKGTWPGTFDFCKSNSRYVELSWQGNEIEIEFIFGKSPQEIISAFTLESGPPVTLPSWAFRPWRWRNEVNNNLQYFDQSKVQAGFNSEIVEDLLMTKALDIPLGVYWIDRPWSGGILGYNDFNFDQKRLPNSKEMLSYFKKNNIRLGLWLAPWVTGELGKVAAEEGLTLGKNSTKEGAFTYSLDFTNPKSRALLQSYLSPLLNAGINVFKLDRADEEIPHLLTQKVNSGKTTLENANDYPRQYQETIFNIAKKVQQDDFVLLSRAGYTGSSKYTAIWGGDVSGSALGLRASIIGMQRAALIGFPYWGSDTGGYSGTLDREILARWIAFSAFNPIMELGPLNNRALWDLPGAGKKRTDSIYDRELLAIYRSYAKIHDALVPYTVETAKQSVQNGVPIVRALFLAYPEQPEAWKKWDQFMYGPDILVAPVWEKGRKNRKVYLPAGEEWVDAWDNKHRYNGGEVVNVDMPIYKIALFVRAEKKNILGDLVGLFAESKQRVEQQPKMSALEKEAGLLKDK